MNAVDYSLKHRRTAHRLIIRSRLYQPPTVYLLGRQRIEYCVFSFLRRQSDRGPGEAEAGVHGQRHGQRGELCGLPAQSSGQQQ